MFGFHNVVVIYQRYVCRSGESVNANVITEVGDLSKVVQTVSDSYPSEECRLREVAESRGMVVIDVPGDGDCMFHAVATSMTETLGEHVDSAELRRQLSSYLRTHECIDNENWFSYYFNYENLIRTKMICICTRK